MDAATFASQSGKPPTLSRIYEELSAKIANPESSIGEISTVIGMDPGLASRVLRMANSAFYGNSSPVGTIEEAVQVIGMREIQGLVLATSVISAFKLPDHLVEVTAFWKHSIACGLASSLLAEERAGPAPEGFFVGGLLHDIGRLMLYLNAPDASRHILLRGEREAATASHLEREVLGFDHAALGAELIRMWRLPHSLQEMVAHHHNPIRAQAIPDVFLIHYADFITSLLEFGNSGEFCVSPLVVPGGCERLVVDEDRIDSFVEQLEQRCWEVFPILTGATA